MKEAILTITYYWRIFYGCYCCDCYHHHYYHYQDVHRILVCCWGTIKPVFWKMFSSTDLSCFRSSHTKLGVREEEDSHWACHSSHLSYSKEQKCTGQSWIDLFPLWNVKDHIVSQFSKRVESWRTLYDLKCHLFWSTHHYITNIENITRKIKYYVDFSLSRGSLWISKGKGTIVNT